MEDKELINDKAGTVFVTGASRSGTTMLSRILGQHSTIMGTKEIHFFGEMCAISNLLDPLTDDELINLSSRIDARQKRNIWGSPPNADEINNAQLLIDSLSDGEKNAASIFSATMTSLANAENKEIGCEQTPRNIFYAERLLKIYPAARIVHVVRDPRDVLASQKNRWQVRRLGAKSLPLSESIRTWFNYHPYTITKLWRKATLLANKLQSHDRFYVVKFEDIINNSESEITKICEFLNIDFQPCMLDIPKIGSSHDDNSGKQKGIKGNVTNRWVSVLGTGDVAVCEWVAKDAMSLYDYQLSSAMGETIRSALLSRITGFVLQTMKYPIHVAGVLVSNPRRAWIQLQAILNK